MKVQVINKSNNQLPLYATPGAAAMDARASFSNIDPKDLIKYGPVVYTLDLDSKDRRIKYISMQPGSRVLIPLDIYVKVPEGYELKVNVRSGMALKSGLLLGNGTGIVDSDYRGNVGVILVNPSWNSPVDIKEGDRICQLTLQKVEYIEWEEVESLDNTERGEGGFGHSGVN